MGIGGATLGTTLRWQYSSSLMWWGPGQEDDDDNVIDDDGVDIGGGHCDPGDIFELMKHCWMSSLHSGCYKYTFGNINK